MPLNSRRHKGTDGVRSCVAAPPWCTIAVPLLTYSLSRSVAASKWLPT